MTREPPSRHDSPDAAARALLRLGNRGPPRTAFLREASELLLGCSGARALVAWLEDGPRTFLWRAERHPSRNLDFELLPPQPEPQALLERALGAVGSGASATVLAHGGRYVRDCGRAEPGAGPRLAVSSSARSLLLLPFEIDADNQGVLQLESAVPDGFSEPDRLESTADLLGAAIAARRAQAARGERVKELACMYGIARIGADTDAPLDGMLARIAELLPPAWQYPEITTARILVGDKAFVSAGFSEGPHRLAAEFETGGQGGGSVEVFYVPERGDPRNAPLLERAPFLEEERHLIEGVARELSSIIERRNTADDRARLRDQVRQADRLATVGHLAAGLAHELNEPLGNILGFAQLALKLPELPEQAARDLDWIVSSSLYAREVIKKLMFFARQTPSQPARVDLSAMVRESLPLVASRSSSASVTVESELSSGELPVRGDRGQLQQVFVNLAVNAIQAMPDGGELRVVTESVPGAVVLVVEDSGTGIPADVVDSIFEPFFTTKDVGEGTGLGLSVAHGIVTAHGGAIQVDSEPGRGTKMTVTLPAFTEDEEPSG